MPATNLSKQPKGWATYPSAGASFSPWADVQYCTAPSTWQYAKKVFAHDGTGWVEVWNNRPVTVNGAGSSSAYDRITVTGTVDPNHFDSTPRFYYKKSTDSIYTADTALSTISGDGSQSVGSRTITGLVENTTYNYYLSATNIAGTSDNSSVISVTTPYDCRTQAEGAAGWSSTTTYTTSTSGCGSCTCGSSTHTDSSTTYTKTGCTSYVVNTTGTCSGCTNETYISTNGTYTTTDGVTATYTATSDWLGFTEYMVPSACKKPGTCGCSCDSNLGYDIYYCSVTNTYRREGPVCFKTLPFCP